MKQKRLTDKIKKELLNTISNNNLEGDSIKNFIQAKGYSPKQAEKFYEEYYITKEEQEIIDLAVKEAQAIWAEDIKNEKYSLENILEEDFMAMVKEVELNKKILSPLEVKSKLLNFGYRPEIAEEFAANYKLSLDKIKDGTFDFEFTTEEKEQLKDVGFSDKQIEKISVPLIESEIQNIKNQFPETVKKKLVSLAVTKSLPVREWVGETETDSILCRWDGQFWYFGTHPIPNRINLMQWSYGSPNIIDFLAEMGFLPPDDYIEVDL